MIISWKMKKEQESDETELKISGSERKKTVVFIRGICGAMMWIYKKEQDRS